MSLYLVGPFYTPFCTLATGTVFGDKYILNQTLAEGKTAVCQNRAREITLGLCALSVRYSTADMGYRVLAGCVSHQERPISCTQFSALPTAGGLPIKRCSLFDMNGREFYEEKSQEMRAHSPNSRPILSRV